MMIEPSDLKAYDIDERIVRIYDETETQEDDVELLRELLAEGGPRRILEPFCGNGRLLLPLAEAGHTLLGLDKSWPMLTSARKKARLLPEAARERIAFRLLDVVAEPWPGGFDAVALGANCLYELATPEEQEACIRKAAGALNEAGLLFLDNNHMEGELDPAWRVPGIQENRFPSGVLEDGTVVEGTSEMVWFDTPKRLVRFRRTVTITEPDSEPLRTEWIEQKHPPSTGEMRAWLETHGFEILHLFGDRHRAPYTDASPRAIFWARLAPPT